VQVVSSVKLYDRASLAVKVRVGAKKFVQFDNITKLLLPDRMKKM
jgi:hypothetical protein